MLSLGLGIIARICSNSYINVFQKLLTNRGERSSVINFYTYLGLSFLSLYFLINISFTVEIFTNVLIMGLLGALGNYFIIKALSIGELSTLAPVNAYKPIVALIFGVLFLGEIPGLSQMLGIGFIIIGTFLLANAKIFFSKSTFYRFLALFFSGIEAIFIKKLIILSNIETTFFYWAVSGLLFSTLFVKISRHSLKFKASNFKYEIFLIILVAIMQYSTNYVFSKMNVAYALALFQLSTILSVFLGVNIFNESNWCRKIIATSIMLFGALFIILS